MQHLVVYIGASCDTKVMVQIMDDLNTTYKQGQIVTHVQHYALLLTRNSKVVCANNWYCYKYV